MMKLWSRHSRSSFKQNFNACDVYIRVYRETHYFSLPSRIQSHIHKLSWACHRLSHILVAQYDNLKHSSSIASCALPLALESFPCLKTKGACSTHFHVPNDNQSSFLNGGVAKFHQFRTHDQPLGLQTDFMVLSR